MTFGISPASTLHTLNASPFEHRALFERLLRFASPGDSLLLLENGVYGICDEKSLSAIFDLGLTLYCLETDVIARGLQTVAILARNPGPVSPENPVHRIDDHAFVALCCQHRKVVSWFP